jgi:flavin reductase (DIM6/NTAB) family NADH-FMN oxidoreductase RutF
MIAAFAGNRKPPAVRRYIGAATLPTRALWKLRWPLLPSPLSPQAPTEGARPLIHPLRGSRDNAFTERQFRDALAQFATGVTIIATRTPGGDYTGFTANSFNSVSLDPPLVLWSLNRKATHIAAFEAAPGYAISVLGHEQGALALRFAQPHADRFEGVGYRLSAGNYPVIDGSVAWFECRHHAVHPAGDHLLFVGEVLACGLQAAPGLVFHQGRFTATPTGPHSHT